MTRKAYIQLPNVRGRNQKNQMQSLTEKLIVKVTAEKQKKSSKGKTSMISA